MNNTKTNIFYKDKILKIIFIFYFLIYSITSLTDCSFEELDNEIQKLKFINKTNFKTIRIPAGECTWTKPILIFKPVFIVGAGINKTTIKNSDYIFILKGNVNPVWISGITFWSTGSEGAIKLEDDGNDQSSQEFRIFDNHFYSFSKDAIEIEGDSKGLIDKNTFIDCDYPITVGGDGENTWNLSLSYFGTDEGVFIERNEFYFFNKGSGNVLSSNAGAKFVFRYNYVYSKPGFQVETLEVLGYCFNYDGELRGTYSFEIYDNTFHHEDGYRCLHIKGCKEGIIYNNHIIDPNLNYEYLIFLSNTRSFSSTCQGNAVGLCSGNEGYPCIDQIQNLYIYNNYLNNQKSNIIYASVDSQGDTGSHIQNNRNYFLKPLQDYKKFKFPHPLINKYVKPIIPLPLAIFMGIVFFIFACFIFATFIFLIFWKTGILEFEIINKEDGKRKVIIKWPYFKKDKNEGFTVKETNIQLKEETLKNISASNVTELKNDLVSLADIDSVDLNDPSEFKNKNVDLNQFQDYKNRPSYLGMKKNKRIKQIQKGGRKRGFSNQETSRRRNKDFKNNDINNKKPYSFKNQSRNNFNKNQNQIKPRSFIINRNNNNNQLNNSNNPNSFRNQDKELVSKKRRQGQKTRTNFLKKVKIPTYKPSF